MSLNDYCNLAVNKLKEIGAYSELKDDDLREVIFKYLQQLYQAEINALAIRIDIEKSNGGIITEQQYKIESQRIEIKLLNRVNEITCTELSEVSL